MRSLRIAISLLFFTATAFLFLDFAAIVSGRASDYILFLQFSPSLIRLTNISLLAGSSLIVVLVLTVLFGRVFCSSICPLGVLQDIVRWLSERLPRQRHRPHFHYTKPRTGLRWTLLAATVASVMGGSWLLLGLLDPFSNFGRIMGLFVGPTVVGLNDLTAWIVPSWWHSSFPLLTGELAHWGGSIFPLGVLALIVSMAVRNGRLFCNSLCPVGTLLGLFSRFSLFRIEIDENACNRCAQCAFKCKAECIDLKTRKIDHSRCVTCFNCVAVCGSSAIRFHPVLPKNHPQTHPFPSAFSPLYAYSDKAQRLLDREVYADESRRRFLGLGFGWLAGIGVTAGFLRGYGSAWGDQPRHAVIAREHPVLPPGAKSLDQLSSSCIRCQLCISSCPTHTLQPALTELGAMGFLQPYQDFQTAYCNYECTRCGDVCPTQAISRLDVKTKVRVKVGEVRFIEENCIVVSNETACGACAQFCPTGAITMDTYAGDLTLPVLDAPVCIGCGACEHVCPAQPQKAIYVEGEAEQGKAKPPRAFPFHHFKDQERFPF